MKTIESIQKIIKVGDSLAVTIPAKDARALGYNAGDNVRSKIEPVESGNEIGISSDYEKFARQYDNALKNLAER